jgi:hypothetical protein
LSNRFKIINSILSQTWCRFKSLTPRSKTLREIWQTVKSMQGGLNSQVRIDSKVFDLRQLWSIMPLWGLLRRRAPCTRELLLHVFSARLWVSLTEVKDHLMGLEISLRTLKSLITQNNMQSLSSNVSTKTLSNKFLFSKTFKKLKKANSRKKCSRKTSRFLNWPSKFVMTIKRVSKPRAKVKSTLRPRTHSSSLEVPRIITLDFKMLELEYKGSRLGNSRTLTLISVTAHHI